MDNIKAKGNGHQPAFAAQSQQWDPQMGLTKREYFAAAAMTGILASGVDYALEGNGVNLGKEAVAAADALLEALEDGQH